MFSNAVLHICLMKWGDRLFTHLGSSSLKRKESWKIFVKNNFKRGSHFIKEKENGFQMPAVFPPFET